jgi:hypothetical protein
MLPNLQRSPDNCGLLPFLGPTPLHPNILAGQTTLAWPMSTY